MDETSPHDFRSTFPQDVEKTIVALAISENHLKQFPERARVVFLATKVDVYEQQYKLFKEHFSSKDPNIRHDLTR